MKLDVLRGVPLERGFVIRVDEPTALYAEGPVFQVRALGISAKVQIGVNSTFDRWANSVDYEAPLPTTRSAVQAVLDRAGSLVKCAGGSHWTATPHTIARKTYCDECFSQLTRPKNQSGKKR